MMEDSINLIKMFCFVLQTNVFVARNLYERGPLLDTVRYRRLLWEISGKD